MDYNFNFTQSPVENAVSDPFLPNVPVPAPAAAPICDLLSIPTTIIDDQTIKQLTVAQLMINPGFMNIYNLWNTAAAQLIESQRFMQDLHKENSRIYGEISSLKAELQTLKISGFRYVDYCY